MRIEFLDKVRHNLFLRYTLIEDKVSQSLYIQTYLREDLLHQILEQCAPFRDNQIDKADQRDHFVRVCQWLSELNQDGFSKLIDVHCDFLFWYDVQNLFHEYFVNLSQTGNSPDSIVLRTLRQMITKSVHLEYFALTDDLMLLVRNNWDQDQSNNWRVLTDIYAIFDELQENLAEQKTTLRLIDQSVIEQNLTLKYACQSISSLYTKVYQNFGKCLAWYTNPETAPTSIQSELCTEFHLAAMTESFVEFVFTVFKTLLRDRPFGQHQFRSTEFLQHVNPVQTVLNLCKIVKNESNQYKIDLVLLALQILDGLTCIDLIKEFKYDGVKKNPYFKEACKQFNLYAQILRSLAEANQQDMQVDSNHHQSQRFLFNYLLYLQDLVELKTREMSTSLYVQIVEPLVHLIAVKPAQGIYKVDLICQEAALLILKTITKRSHVFSDANLLTKIIDRLKTELQILQEDLSGQPSRWKTLKPQNDLEFNSYTLEKRQKFIKDLLGLLCYSIIRMDPTQINQQNNFVPYSRKILESCLFEECLMDFVFLKNTQPPAPFYEKVVDPIFMDCVQLYTFLGNDLPQKLGELIDNQLMLCILQSLDRRIPIQTNMLQVIIKFFKMLQLNPQGTIELLRSHAIERFFETSLDYRSYKMLVMPKGTSLMFDCRQIIHSFAKEHQEIANRIYAQCTRNLDILQQKGWTLTAEFLQMQKDLQISTTEQQKDQLKAVYGKKQINFEQTLEASVALLSCFCMDEIEYIDNISTYSSPVLSAIQSNRIENQLYRLLRTPIICSAADAFIYHFQESATFILMMQQGTEGFLDYLTKLQQFLQQSFQDLYTVLGTNDLDTLSTIQAKAWTDLAEPEATAEQRESLKQLIDEDVAWVAIGKIHVLIEMLIILGTLSKFHQSLGVYQQYQNFIDSILEAPVGGMRCIAKLQSLLHRYYANVYVDCISAQLSRKSSLIAKYATSFENFDWNQFRESDEPFSELEDARNVYYRYELQTVGSLREEKAADLTKTQFEFVLQESKGVIQTFKCYKKIKNLMAQLATNYNRRRFQFRDKLLPQQIAYNKISASLISDQLKLILQKCRASDFSIEQTLYTALLIDRVLPDLSKQINNKWKNQIHGTQLLTLLLEENIVLVIGDILKWAVNQYLQLEQQQGPKCLFHARNIQIIVKECVQFYMSLLKLTYLCSGNMQTYLAYFRRDQQQVLDKQMVQSLFPTCFTLTKNCLLKTVLLPINHILFMDVKMCNSWVYFTGGIQENILKIYQTLCQGSLKEPIDFFGDQSIQSSVYTENQPLRYHPLLQPRRLLHEAPLDEEDAMMVETNEQYVQQLVQMGFSQASSQAVLRHYGNDFEFALNALLRGEFKNAEPETAKPQPEVLSSSQIDVTNALRYENLFGAQTEVEICEQICNLIASTYIKCFTEAFSSTAIANQRQMITKVFQFYKDNINKPTQRTIQRLIINLSKQLQQIPSWFNVCFIVQLLAYIKEDWLKEINLVELLKSVISAFKDQALQVKQWSSLKVKSRSDPTAENLNDKLYSLHVHLSTIFFVLSDFKASQDLANVLKICAPEEHEKSAFEEAMTHKDAEEISEELQQLQGGLLQISEQDKLDLAKMIYKAMIVLLQNFTNVDISIAAFFKSQIQSMLGPSIKVLKILAQLQDFDFRTAFMQDHGLKLLFDINILDTEFESKSFWESDRERHRDIRELMENIWENPKDMQKWYEVLIQRQLFFQFKANYKRLSAEGKLLKDNHSWLVDGMEQLQQKEEVAQETSTKKKQLMVQQPIKRNKSQNKHKGYEEEPFVVPHPKDLKRLMKKYEELNEQDFAEFVKYYNSDIFQHEIVHFQVFLAACAKICVIKEILKQPKEGEESNESSHKYKIMLKKQVLKDLLVDPNYNYGLPQKLPLKPQIKVEGITRTQQEIVNQLLEMFIAQTKGYRMDVLRKLREPQLSEESVLRIGQDGKLYVQPEQERRIYFMDHVQILRSLWTLNARNNQVVGLILKHNDSKTIKFIFRNIFHLTTLTVQNREIQLNQDPPMERPLDIVGFLTSILLFNHGSNLQEKATKKELQQIFIRQLAKSLIQKPATDTPWAISQTLLTKFSAMWLISKLLMCKTYESEFQTKDALGAIMQKKAKYQRLQKTHIVKQLILQCNYLQQPQPFESSQFVLLENIQNASIMLRNEGLFLFQNQRTKCLELCVNLITQVLQLFRSSQSLGKFFRTAEDLGSVRSVKSESSEYHFSSSDGSDDFPDENMLEAAHSLAELMSDVDDDYEEGEEEADYDEELGEEEEVKEEVIMQEEPPILSQTKGPPQSEERSRSSEPSESASQASLDSMSDSVELQREQISFQEQESSYEQQDDEYGSVDEQEEDEFSLTDYQDEEGNEESEQHRRIDRRAFILSQGPQRVTIMRTDIVNQEQDLFDLENNQGSRLMGNFSPNLQRFIQQTPELTNEFSRMLDINFNHNSNIGGGFVENIQTIKSKIQKIRAKAKACEQFYLSKISIFTQISAKPAASQTAESSENFHHNPDAFKAEIQKPQPQVQIPKKAPNPLDIEGMDPLFMENLSAIGLQNIADSHQIHAQLTAQAYQSMFQDVLQDVIQFWGIQSQSRRQDILRQVEFNQCRDLPSDLFAEMRSMYQDDREQFMRLFNPQRARMLVPRPQPQIQQRLRREARIRAERAMSIDSNVVSIQLEGPQASAQPQVDKVEKISCDQYVQNFFIILQDLNLRYENDNATIQTERQAEQVLHQSLIPSLGETALVQYKKIEGLVQVAQTAFMNLNNQEKERNLLFQSIKILHRIPNIRICLILSVLKQGQDELHKARQHCENSLDSCKPYVSKLVFSTEQDLAPLILSIFNVLQTTESLQTTIQAESGNNEILEIVTPLSKDHLLQKFASLIGLQEMKCSIFESLLDLMLDMLRLLDKYPWVVEQQQVITMEEVHAQIVEQIANILEPIFKQDYQGLPVLKLCEFLFDPLLTLTKKPLQQVGQMLNQINSDIIFTFLKNQITQHLTKVSYSELQSDSIRIFQVFKIAQSIQSIKFQNICEEELLLAVFEQASRLVNADEMSQQGSIDRNVLFVFDDAVKSILHLIFCLCEYNLRLILSQKEKTPQEIQINTLVSEQKINLESNIQPHNINRFSAIIKFFIENKRLINKFIQMNSNVINKELVQVALMIPHVFDFDTKRIIWRADIKKKQYNYRNERFQFQVRRESVLEDSYQVLHNLSVKQWRGGIQVEFQGEEGVDGGGLFKEWLSIMSQEIFNEDRALFIKAASGSTYYPNPKSTVQPNYVEMFTFVGKVFGKSLWDGQLLDCYFVKAFYKIMLNMPLSYNDLEDYDSELFKSLNWMIENQGVDAICSSFVETIEYFGESKEVELCEGGKEKLVTDENKLEYVQLVANYRLYKAISVQIDAFLKGLFSVVPQDLLKIFNNLELELLLSGLQNIDIDDLRENTLYQNYTAQSKPVQYLFEALAEFDNLQRSEFIRFVTGSSKVPVEGFRGLRGSNGIQKFTVVKIPSTTQTRLPQSHTCHNQLDLPEYKDKETTKRMLLMAISEGKTFGFA